MPVPPMRTCDRICDWTAYFAKAHMRKLCRICAYMPHCFCIFQCIFSHFYIFSCIKKTLTEHALSGDQKWRSFNVKLQAIFRVSKCTQTHHVDAKVNKKNSERLYLLCTLSTCRHITDSVFSNS